MVVSLTLTGRTMIYPMNSANIWFLGYKGFHITIGHGYLIVDIFGTDLWN